MVEHALRKRTVVGSIPTGGSYLATRTQLRPHSAHVPELQCIPCAFYRLLHPAARWIILERMLSLARLRSEALTDEPRLFTSRPPSCVNDGSRSVMKWLKSTSSISSCDAKSLRFGPGYPSRSAGANLHFRSILFQFSVVTHAPVLLQ